MQEAEWVCKRSVFERVWAFNVSGVCLHLPRLVAIKTGCKLFSPLGYMMLIPGISLILSLSLEASKFSTHFDNKHNGQDKERQAKRNWKWQSTTVPRLPETQHFSNE